MIWLTDQEMNQANELADIRNNGMNQYLRKPGQNRLQHFIGAKGEIAFAKVFGLTVEMVQKPEGDNGVDFFMDGRSIDVKTTEHQYPKLIMRKNKIRSDVYVLAHSKGNKVALMGWIKKNTFIDNHKTLIGVQGSPWYVTNECLNPITTL